jgi:aspartyl/asparaginyl-tRNA synthetase
LSRQPKSH